MRDRGIPATYGHVHGFGSHTFSLINAKKERHWVKFHFKSQRGICNLTDAEAEGIIGKDRESHQRDLYESIEKGDFPRWTLRLQIMLEADAAKVPYHFFDLTKVWPHKDSTVSANTRFGRRRAPLLNRNALRDDEAGGLALAPPAPSR